MIQLSILEYLNNSSLLVTSVKNKKKNIWNPKNQITGFINNIDIGGDLVNNFDVRKSILLGVEKSY